VRLRRRKGEAQPVVLPSLDRLSGLIERVVELVDAVGDTTAVPAPEPVAEPPQDAPTAEEPAVTTSGWVAFVGTAHGYRLVEGPGLLPARGDAVELDGARYEVVKIGRSPLPGDPRACAYVVGEEPQTGDRNPDA
jgi:hypothetical protein